MQKGLEPLRVATTAEHGRVSLVVSGNDQQRGELGQMAAIGD